MDTLVDLRRRFLETSTVSMPLAGLIVWVALGVASFFVPRSIIGWMTVYVMAAILPLAFVVEKMRGRNPFVKDDNPVSAVFFHSIIGIGLMFPLVISAALAAGNPDIMVLGVAILAGIIWIQYGWAADDPVGLRHAVLRAVGCYLAFWFAPVPSSRLRSAPSWRSRTSTRFRPCGDRRQSEARRFKVPRYIAVEPRLAHVAIRGRHLLGLASKPPQD